jgi:hypothetical protein
MLSEHVLDSPREELKQSVHEPEMIVERLEER